MFSFMIINSKEKGITANSTLAMRRTRSQNTLALCVPNWKSSYDVMFMYQSHQQHFANINFYDLDPVIYKNSMGYSGSSQGMRIYIPCLFCISS